MKIAILTINSFYNYGNRLQNFALHTFLKSLNSNIEVETIWCDKNRHKKERIYFVNKVYDLLTNVFGDFSKKCFNKYKRQANLKLFTDKYIRTSYEYGFKDELDKKYDYFIIGSDQIWNPHWVNNNDIFLGCVSPNKRISFAASFGVSEIPIDKTEYFKNGLNRMAHISVRENAGAKIVKELTGKEVSVVLDPTLTLKGDYWSKFCQKPVWYTKEKYILVFFLSKLPDLARIEIERIAEENNFKIIDLMNESKKDYYTSSPEEFLFLIRNAVLVYTDSFHCTVFSILFNVPFVNCSRENAGMNMDSRMDTLLGLFGMQDRKTDKSKNYTVINPLELNYPDVEKILESEREKARQYLLKALGMK